MLEVVILAAGKGKRMRSQQAKVMHPLAGRPLLHHVLARAQALAPEQIHLVVGHRADQIEDYFADQHLNFVQQKEQLGTGHAVQQALPHINPEAAVLVLYGDVPLIGEDTLRRLLAEVDSRAMALLTVELADPSGYGRIVRDDRGQITAIVEQKDANEEQLKIAEANTGVMALRAEHLLRWLPELESNNAQGEFYLTDIIATAHDRGVEVRGCRAANEFEVLGVNNRQQQAQLERHYQRYRADQLMQAGLTLMDPERFDCRGELTVGEDCSVDINCVFEGQVILGNHVEIGPGCLIKNAKIADFTQIQAHSIIEDTQVGEYCTIGPFARLRPGTEMAAGAKVGNFVETKKAVIGERSKVNHLSYIGDASLGSHVNIGAGTITCNYDGANKFETRIDDEVFVGSNAALVAPVSIAARATIGAGSTITQNVGADQLAIGRQRQRNLDGWQRPKKTNSEV